MNALNFRGLEGTPEIDPLLHLPEIMRLIGVSKTTIRRWVKNGLFPRPVTINPGNIAWRASEVARWQQERFAASAAT